MISLMLAVSDLKLQYIYHLSFSQILQLPILSVCHYMSTNMNTSIVLKPTVGFEKLHGSSQSVVSIFATTVAVSLSLYLYAEKKSRQKVRKS